MADTSKSVPKPGSKQEYVGAPHGHYIDVGGQELHYRERDERQPGDIPAVYIHGLGASATNWNEFQVEMGNHVFGSAVDLPGFGRSDKPLDRDYSMKAHASAVAKFVEHRFDGEPVHVFGNSMGGAVALQLVSRRPDLVRSVTYVSPALPDLKFKKANILIPVAAIPVLGERFAALSHRQTPEEQVLEMYERIYAEPTKVHEQRFLDAVYDANLRRHMPHTIEALAGSVRGILSGLVDRSDERPWNLLSQVQLPSLFVYGRHDKLVNSSTAFKITKSMPKARVVVLPKSGHVAQMEHPELVAEAWREFILPITDDRSTA